MGQDAGQSPIPVVAEKNGPLGTIPNWRNGQNGDGSRTDANEIIKKAIEGETKGVNMAEKVLRGDLDERSRDIAGEILQQDRKSIEKIKNLLQIAN